jgi:hypothetical protein
MPVRGPTGKPFLTAACFDANAKANRLASAGRGRPNAASDTRSNCLFFGDAHHQLWQLHAAGPLPLSATYSGSSSNAADTGNPGSSAAAAAVGGSDNGDGGSSSVRPAAPSAAAGTADDADDEALLTEHNCHPHLSCARETSATSSISDECGLVGAVCSHGQPLLGLQAAMPAPERFVYYDVEVTYLQELVDLGVMYLDTGCTYGAHWRVHIPGLRSFVIYVPWWHARGHGEGCYLKNSGFYKAGEFAKKLHTCCA